MLSHTNVGRLERFAQNLDRIVRLGLAAHEDVERGIVGFRPAMDRDVAFRQHRHARHAAIGREMVEVDVEKRRLRHLDATAERRLDMGEIVQTARADQVDDQMRAGKALAVALDEEIGALVGGGATLHRRTGSSVNGKLENFRLGLA